MLHLDDKMANVSVYGIATAAEVFVNRRMHSSNIFRS